MSSARVFEANGLEVSSCGLEKVSCSILVPYADGMPEEILL